MQLWECGTELCKDGICKNDKKRGKILVEDRHLLKKTFERFG